MTIKNLRSILTAGLVGFTAVLAGESRAQSPVTNIEMTVTNNCNLDWTWGTQYMVRAISGDYLKGTVSGDTNQWMDMGSNATLFAVANEDCYFKRYSGDLSSTNNPLNFSVNGPYTNITAEFLARPKISDMRQTESFTLSLDNLDSEQEYSLLEATNLDYPVDWIEKMSFIASSAVTNISVENINNDNERRYYKLKLK